VTGVSRVTPGVRDEGAGHAFPHVALTLPHLTRGRPQPPLQSRWVPSTSSAPARRPSGPQSAPPARPASPSVPTGIKIHLPVTLSVVFADYATRPWITPGTPPRRPHSPHTTPSGASPRLQRPHLPLTSHEAQSGASGEGLAFRDGGRPSLPCPQRAPLKGGLGIRAHFLANAAGKRSRIRGTSH
jgi:hypothetical protein